MSTVAIVATTVTDEDRWLLELNGWAVTERHVQANISDRVWPDVKVMLVCRGREASPDRLTQIKQCFGARGNVFVTQT